MKGKRRKPIFDFLETPLMPIVNALLDSYGPATMIDAIAELARERTRIEISESDREFWRQCSEILDNAADQIAKSSER